MPHKLLNTQLRKRLSNIWKLKCVKGCPRASMEDAGASQIVQQQTAKTNNKTGTHLMLTNYPRSTYDKRKCYEGVLAHITDKHWIVVQQRTAKHHATNTRIHTLFYNSSTNFCKLEAHQKLTGSSKIVREIMWTHAGVSKVVQQQKRARYMGRQTPSKILW